MTPVTHNPGSLAWEHTPTQWNKKAKWNATDVHHIGGLFISVRKAAEILGISQSTLRRWIKKGIVNTEKRYRNGLRELVAGEPRTRLYTVISRYDLTSLVLGRQY